MFNRPRETASGRAGRLYDELGAELYRYAVMLLADAAAAEDAIQQVFAALLRNSGRIENEPAVQFPAGADMGIRVLIRHP